METLRPRRLRLALGLLLLTAAAWALSAAVAPRSSGAVASKGSYTVVLAPPYTTAGDPTTFTATIKNTSAGGTSLGSVDLRPPPGFKLVRAVLLRGAHAKVGITQNVVEVRGAHLPPGSSLQARATAIAPSACAQAPLRWRSAAWEGPSGSGHPFALGTAASKLGATVTCEMVAPCGDGGPPCSVTVTTNVSKYTAISDANSGTLVGALDYGTPLTCAGYRSKDANWYESTVTGAKNAFSYKIEYTLENTRPKLVHACMGLTSSFKTLTGRSARRAALPNGKAGFIGLLPRCTSKTPGPCVVSVRGTRNPNSRTRLRTNLVVRIPASSDPWMGG